MIIEHRQGIATTAAHREITFEVHLPKIIRLWVDKTDPWFMFQRLFIGEQMMTLQNAGDGTCAGYLDLSSSEQARAQFAPAPGWMLVAFGNHRFLNLRSGPCGRVVWTTRKFL